MVAVELLEKIAQVCERPLSVPEDLDKRLLSAISPLKPGVKLSPETKWVLRFSIMLHCWV